MTWRNWLKEGRVEALAPIGSELVAQRRAAERSLKDAALEGLSPEGRFQLAYVAALDLATIAVRASGYRIKSRLGHHQLTFEAAGVALGESSRETIDYFDLCRRRRNVISYDGDEVSQALADELLAESVRFAETIDRWLRTEHPGIIE